MKLKNSWEKKGEYLNSVNSFYHQEKKRKMEKRQKLCYLIHFFNLNLDSLNNRIIFQKSIYLLQQLGLDLGYKFNWYHYGPYSPELASDGFGIIREETIKPERIQLDKNILKQFEELIKNNAKRSVWFELLASIIFLKKEKHLRKEELFGKLKKHQPYLGSREEFENAWKKLEEFSLV